MIKKICRWCHKDFTLKNRKSKVSCSDKCAYEFKKQDTINKNAVKRQKLHLAIQDDILKNIYELDGNKIISSAILEALNFDWSLCTKEITINSLKAYVIKNYSYILFKNQTIQIWKL